MGIFSSGALSGLFGGAIGGLADNAQAQRSQLGQQQALPYGYQVGMQQQNSGYLTGGLNILYTRMIMDISSGVRSKQPVLYIDGTLYEGTEAVEAYYRKKFFEQDIKEVINE